MTAEQLELRATRTEDKLADIFANVEIEPIDEAVLQQLLLFPTERDEAFKEWVHTDLGREIMRKVIAIAVVLADDGWKHYGIAHIIDRIRWSHDLKHGPDADGFKINNNWRSRIARYAMMKRPDKLAGFFRVRELKT